MEAYTFYIPMYRLSGLIKLSTAVVSATTVFLLIPVLPKAMSMRFPEELEKEIRDRQKAEAELKALNETLERRVSERTAELEKQTKQLRSLNQAILKSNQELDDFVYIASHDLKEPLRGIANFSQFLQEDYGAQLDAEGNRKLQTLRKLAKRMSDQIDSLHKFSQVGSVDLAMTSTNLNNLVNEVVEVLRFLLEEHRVTVRIPHPLPTITCDQVRVREVFYNLIANAAKYNDYEERWVEIGVISSSPFIVDLIFYVRDNGIGIPETQKETIFRMFRRLHGRNQFGGGTGVGLTLTKKIVERHGGLIWVESVPGEGTTFYFTLSSSADSHHGKPL